MREPSCARPSCDLVVGYLVVALLTVSWLTLTGLKVAEYLSEPTATRTHWQIGNHLAAFTVCPAYRTDGPLYDNETTRGASTTLTDLFDLLSLPPEEMVLDLNMTAAQTSSRSPARYQLCTERGCVQFKTSYDYNIGGVCLTSEPASIDNIDLVLLPNPAFHQEIADYLINYDLIFHGQPDFYGDVYLGDQVYYMSSVQRGLVVTVTIDRHIDISLSRSPCNSDPAYSQRLCERDCFLGWLNCSMHEQPDTDRPRCMADTDSQWFENTDMIGDFYEGAGGLAACPCPKQCVTDMISVSTRPDYYIEPDNRSYVRVQPARAVKVLETYITYTLYDLLADMGGFLGLLLGSSILSVYQMLPELVRWARGAASGPRDTAPAPAHNRWISPGAAEKTRVSVLSSHLMPPAHRGDLVLRISPPQRTDRTPEDDMLWN